MNSRNGQVRHNRHVRRLSATAIVALILTACASEDVDPVASTDQSDTAAADATSDAEPPQEVLEAAAWAEDNGMLFLTDRDEIVRMAEEIGTVNILTALDSFDEVQAVFQEAFPNLLVHVEQFSGTDTHQRFLLESSAGVVEGWDVLYAPADHYNAFTELMAPYDIYGMAEVGILDIPVEMIDPDLRYVVSWASQLAGFAYNPTLISEQDLPETWEDLLEPRFFGELVVDIQPNNVAPLVDLWGEERVYEFAEKLAAQEPTWVRGNTDAMTRIASGENTIMAFANYHSGVRIMERDPEGDLAMGLLEPIPVRISETMGVLNPDISDNPYAALLFLEWLATPESQQLLDDDPLKSHIYASSGRLADLIEDREISVADFRHFAQMENYMTNILDAYGFPTAEE